MSIYRTNIPVPDAYRQFIEAITSVAEIIEVRGDHIVVDFVDPTDVDDEYALAEIVRDLQDEINAIGFTDPISVPRPRKIDEATDA